MKEILNPFALEIINQYKNLIIRGITVQTPYYRNVKRTRAELRSLVGKGTPEELIEETIIFAQLRGFKIQNSNPEEVKEFMESQGVGIDCSGFVAHIINHILYKKYHKGIFSYVKFPKASLYRAIIRWLRPIENLSADLLTGELNSDLVDYNDVKPGYFIRLKGVEQGHHIALISETNRDKTGKLLSFKYIHSTNHYNKENGVKEGEIIITNNKKPLQDQNWIELDKNGKCYTKEQYITQVEDNGIVKPKFYEYIK